jgi:hypothetical protein
MARARLDHRHRRLRRAGAKQVQGLLAGLIGKEDGAVDEAVGTGGIGAGAPPDCGSMGIGAGPKPSCGTGPGAAPGAGGVGTGAGPCPAMIGGVGPLERGTGTVRPAVSADTVGAGAAARTDSADFVADRTETTM